MTFAYAMNGKNYEKSSDIPTITVDGKEMPRKEFWAQVIQGELAKLPVTQGAPTYIATGGGYGSNEKLIGFLKEQGSIAADIPSVKGEPFRTHPALLAEKAGIVAQIQKQYPDMAAADVEKTYRAFCSDEVNTQLAKGEVLQLIAAKRSSIHESASIYPDTLERAQAAKAAGMTTRLVAGDMDFTKALQDPKVNAFNTATSYQRFAARFHTELVPAFDEIQLYNTDGKTPILIAEKKGAGQELVVLNPELYAKFQAKAVMNPEQYKTAATGADVTAQNHLKGLYTNPGAQPCVDGRFDAQIYSDARSQLKGTDHPALDVLAQPGLPKCAPPASAIKR